ncbi:MAG: hypothetical protein NVSMB53_10390 [Gemmatimonadaceae bacterium]
MYRNFADPDNRLWEVWCVLPTAAKRGDRRLLPLTVKPGYENGWLCFEREGKEKRRLAPVPEHWETATAKQLWHWCGLAVPVPPRRD